MTNYCDICGRDTEVALVASGCAPVTYAACESCRGRGAEGIGVAALWWHLNGGGHPVRLDFRRTDFRLSEESVSLPKDDQHGRTG